MLTPLAFDPGHPFPYISNLSMNLAVRVRHAGRTKFARVKVPSMLPRFIALPDSLSPQPGVSHVFLEDVIRRNIQSCSRARRSKARTCSASSATPTW